ncbi:hypothetical protein [Mycobacterium hackensackense]|uniref:hypothetical protein n=1 Tax=Mycobacterium hackensackense TaxID=228909 RepID=UPI002265E407|nr:hypothetical protein [Mycobacterium hackensackense]
MLSAAISMAALGLSGCSADPVPPAPTATVSSVAAPPGEAALPAPEALTDVLSRLADTSVPGEQKVALVQYATPDDAAALDNFGRALSDNRLLPLTFTATDLAWAPDAPGDVVATMTVSSAASPNPQPRPFVYPMRFTPTPNGWQMSRDTANQLLEMGTKTPLPTPTPPPAPPPR